MRREKNILGRGNNIFTFMNLHDTSNSVRIDVRFNGGWKRLRENNVAKICWGQITSGFVLL